MFGKSYVVVRALINRLACLCKAGKCSHGTRQRVVKQVKTLSLNGPDQMLGEPLISTITSDLTSKEAAQDDRGKHGFTTHTYVHNQLIQARMPIIPHAILILHI